MSDGSFDAAAVAVAGATAGVEEDAAESDEESGPPPPRVAPPTTPPLGDDDAGESTAAAANAEAAAAPRENGARRNENSTLSRSCTENLLECGVGVSVVVAVATTAAATESGEEAGGTITSEAKESAAAANDDHSGTSTGGEAEVGERGADTTRRGRAGENAATRYLARRAEARAGRAEDGDDEKAKQRRRQSKQRNEDGAEGGGGSDESRLSFCTFGDSGRRTGAEGAAAAATDGKLPSASGDSSEGDVGAGEEMGNRQGDGADVAGRNDSAPAAREASSTVSTTSPKTSAATRRHGSGADAAAVQNDDEGETPRSNGRPQISHLDDDKDAAATAAASVAALGTSSSPPPATTATQQRPGAEHVRGRGPGRAPAWARLIRRASTRVFRSILFSGSSSTESMGRRREVVVIAAELAPGEEEVGADMDVAGPAAPRRPENADAVPVHTRGAHNGPSRRFFGGSVVFEGVAVESDAKVWGSRCCGAGRLERSLRSSRRCQVMVAIGCLLFVVAIVLGVVLPRQHQGNASSDTNGSSEDTERAPDLSPQTMALQWLAEEDAFANGSASSPSDPSSPQFQRYCLAVLYFATGGPVSWNQTFEFLRPSHECEWHEQESGQARDWRGVRCDEWNNVTEIKLAHNNLTGSIPEELTSITSLILVKLSKNSITGLIPDSIGDLRYLEIFKVEQNKMGGPIHNSFVNMTSLREINLSFNGFNSTIPPTWTSLSNLQAFHAYANELSGSLSISSYHSLHSLSLLSLGQNQMTGTLSPALGTLPNLKMLDLSLNAFHGHIPPGLASHSLKALVIAGNNISGTIPPEIFAFGDSLQVAGLGDNSLSGTVPSNAGSPKQLVLLDLSMNRLSGRIPASLGNHPTLQGLNLRSNQLHGTIPKSIGNSTQMQGLMLENNELSGPVPDSFRDLKQILWLSLARNDLSGSLNEVCAEHEESQRTKVIITADCKKADCKQADCQDDEEVHCDCCTSCCSDTMPESHTCSLHFNMRTFAEKCVVPDIDHNGDFNAFGLSDCVVSP